jgi:hypothetical protein
MKQAIPHIGKMKAYLIENENPIINESRAESIRISFLGAAQIIILKLYFSNTSFEFRFKLGENLTDFKYLKFKKLNNEVGYILSGILYKPEEKWLIIAKFNNPLPETYPYFEDELSHENF